jgi:hypothetical protein
MDRDQIEASLLKKGFVRKDGGDHRYFHHQVNGKNTGVYTKTSHGSKYKTLDNSLLAMMKRQLKLDSLNEFRDLVNCPMSGSDYIEKLRVKRII